MGIRSSINANAIRDNVSPIPKLNTDDARGTVDPNGNPFDGSVADKLGIEQEGAASIMMGIANTRPDGLGVPKEMPVRDLLSFVRMPLNDGWGVETRYRQRVRSPLTAVRGFCVVTCQSGSAKAVAECKNLSCPLWGLRLGRNVHYGKKR